MPVTIPDNQAMRASSGSGDVPALVIQANRVIGTKTFTLNKMTNLPLYFFATLGPALPSGLINPQQKTEVLCQLALTVGGPLTPATGANDTTVGTVSWTGPTNIQTNTAATVNPSTTATQTTRYLKATGYAFAVPTDSTITGIAVSIDRKASSSTLAANCHDANVQLVKGGVILSTNKADTVTTWGASYSTVTYGSGTDLWGASWQPADINSSTFGAVLAALVKTSGANSCTVSVDQMKITVYYSVPGSTVTINRFLDGSPDIGNTTNDLLVIRPNTHWANAAANIAKANSLTDTSLGINATAANVTATNVMAAGFLLTGTVYNNGVVSATFQHTVTGGEGSQGWVQVSFAHGYFASGSGAVLIPKVRGRMWSSATNSFIDMQTNLTSNISYSGKGASLYAMIQSVDSTNINVMIAWTDALGISFISTNGFPLKFQFFCEPFAVKI